MFKGALDRLIGGFFLMGKVLPAKKAGPVCKNCLEPQKLEFKVVADEVKQA
jgi:hypothetical protein